MELDLTVILVAMFATIPPTLMAWLAYKKGNSNQADIERVHVIVNSQKDELLREIVELKSRIALFNEGPAE